MNNICGITKQDFCHQHIVRPNKNDILCGRGKFTQIWHGNIFYRNLIHSNKLEYVIANELEKRNIADSIIITIRKLNPPGRFLKLDEEKNEYYDIGDKKAIHKIKQCLREGANHLKIQITPYPFNDTNQNRLEDDDDCMALLSLLRDHESSQNIISCTCL